MPRLLPDLLRLDRIDLQFAPVLLRERNGDEIEKRRETQIQEVGLLAWIRNFQSIRQPPRQQQRMAAWSPFVLITRQNDWLLPLLHPETAIGLRLIVILSQIPRLGVVINPLQIE